MLITNVSGMYGASIPFNGRNQKFWSDRMAEKKKEAWVPLTLAFAILHLQSRRDIILS